MLRCAIRRRVCWAALVPGTDFGAQHVDSWWRSGTAVVCLISRKDSFFGRLFMCRTSDLCALIAASAKATMGIE